MNKIEDEGTIMVKDSTESWQLTNKLRWYTVRGVKELQQMERSSLGITKWIAVEEAVYNK
jgi:hypothetical protein